MQRKSMSRVMACALAVAAVGVASTSVAIAHQRDEGRSHAKHAKHGENGEHGDHHGTGDGLDRSGIPFGPGYTVTPLVSDKGGGSVKADPHLINGWGISVGPTTPWWVSNNGTNTSTLYTADGTPQPLVVAVPGGPTGTVFNGGTGFPVMSGGKPVTSRFLFATQAGTIEGWSPTLPVTTASVTAIPAAGNAIFTGLAISADNSMLYAADFANGKVDVWDSTWAPVSTPGAFTDPYLPPSQHYAPFGIQEANGSIFVTYAKQSSTPGDELHGRGLGVVDEYSPAGAFIARVGAFGDLNAPWGVAMAPAAGFGTHAGELLVGNFGDGRISTFVKLPSGRWLADDQLRDANGHRIAIDGLWGIGFGKSVASGLTTSLYFAAGPDDETEGLFGTVTANP
jgi:uncharacterized protein (TIGR03118 family)